MLRKRFAAALIAVPLVLGGCSGGGDSSKPAEQPPATATQPAEAQPGQEVDPGAFFQKTQQATIDAKTYAMTVQMSSSSGEKVNMTGSGDLSDAQRPKADMKMTMPGGSEQVHMIIDGENVFMQMPGATKDGKFIEMPMSALSQAGGQDLTKMMNPAENLKLTQQAVEKVVFQGTEDVSGEKLRRYQITMNPQKLQESLTTAAPSAQPSGMPESLPYDVWIDDADRMRKMTMTIEGMQMEMTATDYGKPVTITPPPSASVTQMPGLSEPASPAPSAS